MHKIKRLALERKVLFIRVAAILLPLAIALLLLSQTAFAQTTYVITDGSRVLVHTTSATNPEDVLGEAGLKLGADDTYTTQAVDGGSEICVRRSQRILIDYYGEQMEVSSFGETVEQLLKRLNLSWGEDDQISLPLRNETYDGMELTIASVIQEDQTYTAVLDHETVYCSDASLPEGEELILTEGVDGQLLCSARVTYINGRESERQILSQQVTTQPVAEVVAVGTGEAQASAEETRMPIIGEDTITLPTGEVLSYTGVITSLATAYCDKGTTATGTEARVGAIAVDPRVIPYGTRMFIVSTDGEYVYGIATAEDTGSRDHIMGTRIDLHFDTKAECRQFGSRDCLVYFLG